MRGGRQEEGGVERDAHEDVEPEHRVIVGVRGGLLVGQRHLEPAVLQGHGHEREHADDGHHAIVGGCQQAPQDDAEQQAYDLLHHRVHAAPEQSAGSLLFQCLHSSIVVIFCLQLLLFLLATVLFLLAVAFSLLAMVFSFLRLFSPCLQQSFSCLQQLPGKPYCVQKYAFLPKGQKKTFAF